MAYGILIKNGSDAVVLDTTKIVSRIVHTQSITIVSGVNQTINISTDYSSTNAVPMTDLGANCYFSAAGSIFINGTRSTAGAHVLYVISIG